MCVVCGRRSRGVRGSCEPSLLPLADASGALTCLSAGPAASRPSGRSCHLLVLMLNSGEAAPALRRSRSGSFFPDAATPPQNPHSRPGQAPRRPPAAPSPLLPLRASPRAFPGIPDSRALSFRPETRQPCSFLGPCGAGGISAFPPGGVDVAAETRTTLLTASSGLIFPRSRALLETPLQVGGPGQTHGLQTLRRMFLTSLASQTFSSYRGCLSSSSFLPSGNACPQVLSP